MRAVGVMPSHPPRLPPPSPPPLRHPPFPNPLDPDPRCPLPLPFPCPSPDTSGLFVLRVVSIILILIIAIFLAYFGVCKSVEAAFLFFFERNEHIWEQTWYSIHFFFPNAPYSARKRSRKKSRVDEMVCRIFCCVPFLAKLNQVDS